MNHASGGLGDASLYKGRYYIYWGPVTALLHVPSRLLLGIPLPTTVLMVTHERALAERYAGRIVTLADGRIERIEQR